MTNNERKAPVWQGGPVPFDFDSRPSLTDLFKAACDFAPALAEAELVRASGYGLVLRNKDESFTKLALRFSDGVFNAEALEGAVGEINALRLFRGYAGLLGGLHVPVLLAPPQEFPLSSPFSYAYRMTPVAGVNPGWIGIALRGGNAAKEYFQQAGAVLARFHEAAAGLPLAHSVLRNWWDIRPVEFLPDRLNKGLEIAAQYMEDRTIPGVVHGDFQGGNIMHRADGRITGLIDFGYARYESNIYGDMLEVPSLYLNDFIAGYDKVAETPVHRAVVLATKLGRLTYQASTEDADYGTPAELARGIGLALEAMAPVTGYKP